jgi:hypothetical protein
MRRKPLTSQKAIDKPRPTAKCIAVFERGVKNMNDVMLGMSLMMGDIVTERLTTSVANSVALAAGRMLKAAELQQRYGKKRGATDAKIMKLVE